MPPVRLSLSKALGKHLRAGHPWVFRDALESLPRIPPGSIVDIVEHGHFVARGYYDPLSAIAVRILTRDEGEPVDAAFFRRRVAEAVDLRRQLGVAKQADSYRLVHGEGDGLPGVVVDLYAGYAVLKLYSAGLTPHRSLILEAVTAAVPGLKGLVGRDEIGRDDVEHDTKGAGRVLYGEEAPELVTIDEGGARFLVDVYRGQKTGFFLDQRENRLLIRKLSDNREVLNLFSFSGGFSVNAALGGARHVTSVDLDADALALARQNFEANGIDPSAHDFIAADAFEAIREMEKQGRAFDLVILDPPAFAKTQRAVAAAIAGYASLNRQALALLKPGGLLATASCTARVSGEAFLDAVKEAGFKARVDLRLLWQRYQPPDHPVSLQFPEGRYLKFLVCLRAN